MARFSLLLIALIAVTGWITAQKFDSAAERQAIIVSGVLAVVIQMAAFGLVKLFGRRNATLVGWILGTVLRGTALFIYGLVYAKMLALPLPAALTSFAVFLFASMLLESFLISYAS